MTILLLAALGDWRAEILPFVLDAHCMLYCCLQPGHKQVSTLFAAIRDPIRCARVCLWCLLSLGERIIVVRALGTR